MNKEKILDGKRVLITGASSGIGKALAFGMAALGASVGLLSRSENTLREICQSINENAGTAAYAAADITNFDAILAGVEKLIEEIGGVDVLINNAGIARKETWPKSPAEIDVIIDTNLKGAFYCAHVVIPHLREQGRGSIINTSSALGLISIAEYVPFNIAYSTTKAALNMFTVTLANQLLASRVRVNAILPGFVDTPLIQEVPQATLDEFGIMPPEKLVPYYAFFASDNSRSVTGQLIPVELFQSALRFVNKFPSSIRRSWQELNPLIKERFTGPKYRVYGDAYQILRKNHRLLLALLEPFNTQ